MLETLKDVVIENGIVIKLPMCAICGKPVDKLDEREDLARGVMGTITMTAHCHGAIEEVVLQRQELDMLECIGGTTIQFCEAFRPLRALTHERRAEVARDISRRLGADGEARAKAFFAEWDRLLGMPPERDPRDVTLYGDQPGTTVKDSHGRVLGVAVDLAVAARRRSYGGF